MVASSSIGVSAISSGRTKPSATSRWAITSSMLSASISRSAGPELFLTALGFLSFCRDVDVPAGRLWPDAHSGRDGRWRAQLVVQRHSILLATRPSPPWRLRPGQSIDGERGGILDIGNDLLLALKFADNGLHGFAHTDAGADQVDPRILTRTAILARLPASRAAPLISMMPS